MSYQELAGQKGLFNALQPRAWRRQGSVVLPENSGEEDQARQIAAMQGEGGKVQLQEHPLGLKFPAEPAAKEALEELQDQTLA